MEFPELGENCSLSTCKQLDFLPIPCPNCRLNFCKHHNLPHNHQCSQPSPVEEGRQHIDTSHLPTSYPCSYDGGCKERELTPVVCKFCNLQLCLKHRAQTDHGCVKLTIKTSSTLTPKEKVEKITGKQLSTQKPTGGGHCGKKSAKTSSKVIEMKLKMKAKGNTNTPVEERVYLDVEVKPLQCNVPLFFSKMSSVGKMVDSAAVLLKLKNENHVTSAPKLRFVTVGGVVVPTDVMLGDVLSGDEYELSPFGNVCLDYVQPN